MHDIGEKKREVKIGENMSTEWTGGMEYKEEKNIKRKKDKKNKL
jgi:hypothetical protein